MLALLDIEGMRRADAAAVAAVGSDALVHRAGGAVAQECRRLLGSLYGRRVAVVVGPGLNGADGRVAGAWLSRRGARVDLVTVAEQPTRLRGYDLVVDAAFGLGCSRPYEAPDVGETPVVAVDLPSGVDADTGALLGRPPRATLTVALGALKPAHVSGPAAHQTGRLVLHRLGIVEDTRDGLVEDLDLRGFVTGAPADHKWRHAVAVLAGSALMPGAARLVAEGAIAGGASMVRLASRADVAALELPVEVVRTATASVDPRCRAVVAGPGLGPDAADWLAPVLAEVEGPVVLDADALHRSLLEGRRGATPWVLTPHEGEFARLCGGPVPEDRLGAVRALARETGCVVLLKGPITLIAAPEGTTRVVTSGTRALATAGTGDVLAGMIAGALARGHDPLSAAALSAHVHGRAGGRLGPYGSASDLPLLVRHELARLSA